MKQIWVSSGDARLKADKSASSKTIAELPVGMALSVLGSDGKWYNAATASGKKGWIYRGKVSDSPPKGKDEGGFGGDSDIHADASDTSRSIRSMAPMFRTDAASPGPTDVYQQALDSVLSFRPGKEELENFLKAGNIGEYQIH